MVDAGWSKRTHKHMYNALSSVGIIFGLQTGKLLYIGVRNRYCATCQKDANKKHVCFKIWEEASSSMETDIILAGFKVAQAQHGVRYTNYIGDSDSSVYSALVANVPEWGYRITKQECVNHALKCFRASLEQLVKEKPQYKGKHKLTAAMRQRLTKDVRCAIIMRSQHEDKIQAAILLQQDIMNCANHCFGIHCICKPEYCKTVRSKTTNNLYANVQPNASSSYTPPQNFDRVSVPSAYTQTSPILHLPEDPPEYTEMDAESIDQPLRNSSAIGKMPLIPVKLLTMMRIWTHHSL